MSNLFFFDTYAFIEAIKGNPSYQEYIDKSILTTIFNLAELNYILKKEMAKEKADRYTQEYAILAVTVTIDDIKKAMDFKIKHRDFSIPDAIGYNLAKRYGAKFLTGDSGFKDFSNVEFVR